MPRILNPVTTRPADLQPGDHMFVLVKAIVNYNGGYSLYRCAAPEELQYSEIPEHALPQGSPISYELQEQVARALMPVLTWMEE